MAPHFYGINLLYITVLLTMSFTFIQQTNRWNSTDFFLVSSILFCFVCFFLTIWKCSIFRTSIFIQLFIVFVPNLFFFGSFLATYSFLCILYQEIVLSCCDFHLQLLSNANSTWFWHDVFIFSSRLRKNGHTKMNVVTIKRRKMNKTLLQNYFSQTKMNEKGNKWGRTRENAVYKWEREKKKIH